MRRAGILREVSKLRRALLAWYGANRRDLPWRRTRDPYRVWVSEIMLQQTRVAAVLPRYEKFLRRFPSVQKLAAAREASVLTEWSGLGYYRRARNLHAAAKAIAGQRRGQYPQTAQGWRELPGIGRYTAAAIASIAFNDPVAVLDGNVKRMIGRLADIQGDGNLWIAAQALLDRDRPGDFNQAMMELGALVCLPRQPLCAQCPIQAFCRTRGRGGQNRVSEPRVQRDIAYALVRRNGSVRLVRRSAENRLMPGMFELPQVDGTGSCAQPMFTLRHSITVTDYRVSVIAQPQAGPGGTWVQVSRLNTIPLTGLAKKILQRAQII